MAQQPVSDRPDNGPTAGSQPAEAPRPWYWSGRYVGQLLVIVAGFVLLVVLGRIANARWDQYPIVELVAEAYDPSELLRGAYVDLRVQMPRGEQPATPETKRVRFLAAEDDAKAIEGVLRGERGQRGQKVTLEARLAPDGRLRPLAVITPDDRRFPTR